MANLTPPMKGEPGFDAGSRKDGGRTTRPWPRPGKPVRNFKGRLKKRKKKGVRMEGQGLPRLGNLKGQMRYTPKGYKKVRRFTVKERNAFRTKRGPVFGGPKDGRPTPR